MKILFGGGFYYEDLVMRILSRGYFMEDFDYQDPFMKILDSC